MSFRDEENPRSSKHAYAPLAADGTYRATGLEPGAYRVTVDRLAPTPGSMFFVIVSDDRVVVVPDAREVKFDAELALAGILSVTPRDPRFPPGAWEGKPTEAQGKFGAASRLVVRAADGSLILDRTGVARHMDDAGWLRLVPGRYVARLEMPGGDNREETVDLTAGATVYVSFERK